MLNGYWVFQPPIGYEYRRIAGRGNMIVPKEPYASILREAMEGYACGRLETQYEVKRFLEGFPEWPKDLPNGEIRHQRIHDILTRPVYAGRVENPKWNVPLREGQHEGLIDWQTYERIQERLTGGRKAPARKDINADFPLRQFVLCNDCQKPLTACWSKSSTGVKHPYYLCPTKGCASYRKSIRRGDLEGEFAALVRTLQPTASLVTVARAMFKDAWDQRSVQAESMVDTMKRQIGRIEKEVDQIVARIVETSNPTVAAAFEAKIEKLEREKIVLSEKVAAGKPNKDTYEELFELAMAFLSSPWKLWESGQLNLRRTVLRLAFSERISYDRKTGFRTPKTTLPFKVLEAFSTGKSGMARPKRVELLTF